MEKNAIKALDITMTAMDCPTERPMVRYVFGVCQFETLRELMAQYPKKWKAPHVLLEGGRGMRSRLDQESVFSWASSSPVRRSLSLTPRKVVIVAREIFSTEQRIGVEK